MMNRRTFASIACALAAFAVAPAGMASNYGTKDEAVAMAKRAAAHIKAVGKDKALADFTAKAAGFSDRDLYVMVYDQTGKNVAHGANDKLVGRDLIAIKDADGKEIVRELIGVAFKGPGKGWVDYKWPNPVTKQVEAKTTYVEKVDDLLVGVGVYKTN